MLLQFFVSTLNLRWMKVKGDFYRFLRILTDAKPKINFSAAGIAYCTSSSYNSNTNHSTFFNNLNFRAAMYIINLGFWIYIIFICMLNIYLGISYICFHYLVLHTTCKTKQCFSDTASTRWVSRQCFWGDQLERSCSKVKPLLYLELVSPIDYQVLAFMSA